MANKSKAKELVLSTYSSSRDFYQSYHNELEETWRLANGEVLKKKRKFNRYIPYIPAAIDLILPRLAGRLPIFEIVGRTQDDHQHASVMQKVVDYFLDKTNFHDFELKFIRQAIIFGTAIAQVGWDFKKAAVHPDLAKEGMPTDVVRDDPEYTIIPLENVFPHPQKIRMQDDWPIVVRSEVSRRDLMNDPNVDSRVLGQVGAPKSEEEIFSQINRSPRGGSQNTTRMENDTADKDSDVFIVYTYYGPYEGKNYIISVVNGSQVVRCEPNPFWHQQIPFVKLDYTADPHRFFNTGLVAQLRDMQLELNEIRNVRSAARAIALKTPLMVDRNAGIDIDSLKFEPGAVWPYDYDKTRNAEPIRPFTVPSKLLELDREETAVKADLQLRSGMNDVTVGQDASGGVQGGDTATGAAIAAEQTSLRFKTQAIMIDEAIQCIGEQTISNIQQFIDRENAFRITGDPKSEQKFEWLEYSPELMKQFRFDFKVAPMSTFVEPKAAKREKLISLKSLYADDPKIDQGMLDRMILEAFDMDPDQILRPEAEVMADQDAMQLQELATQINSPEFAQLPPEEQQMMFEQLQQLKAQVDGGQQPVGEPSMAL